MTFSKFSCLPSFSNQVFFSIEPGIENSYDRFLIAIRFLLIEEVVKRGFTGPEWDRTVADPDFQITGGGGGHPDLR